MFVIVSIAGQQFKVEEGQKIFVHRLAANEGDSVSFDSVHLVDNGGNRPQKGQKGAFFQKKPPQRLSQEKRTPPIFHTNQN